ncbi:MotA/TolQ/ExbB proton channel family protein [Methanobrevibacter sp. TMH8]|uniref:MotA/TolQ/ExbB proton channel family protein n=1 Tax=Methanobrevibacter sp. TMH8 TaxID=2848611 RepID=UPI001CCFD62E|nr:MotA/TolQ/ExbB proton channel family protein [Methanobrevibacter sp. TMH8]MBZ9570646.1 MotA/TolQ/ExbB proton channel family protein [Methanobrevibacter sp. TMH8]
MVLNIPGSGILTSTLNVISQSLLIPVIILLLIFAVYAVITIGSLISEYSSRKKVPISTMKKLIHDISLAENVEVAKNAISLSEIPEKQKEDLLDLISSKDLSKESLEALARKLIENEENLIDKILEKTDIMARIGPTLGLMGTLIPMGPGLAALGSGDINGLANAIIVAFDTTVVGIGAGGIGYFVSKIRKRWYDDYLSNLDALSDAVLDFMKKNHPD